MQTDVSVVKTNHIINKMLLWQSVATCSVGLIAFFYAGKHAGLSVLIGGLSVVVATFVARRIANRSQYARVATAALVNMLVAEVVKVFLIFVLLSIAYVRYEQLVPIALILGLMVAASIAVATMHSIKGQFK